MYVTVSISTGLYPKLDLWKVNKLHYITLPVFPGSLYEARQPVFQKWPLCSRLIFNIFVLKYVCIQNTHFSSHLFLLFLTVMSPSHFLQILTLKLPWLWLLHEGWITHTLETSVHKRQKWLYHLLKMWPALSVLNEFKSVGFKIVIIMMTINII